MYTFSKLEIHYLDPTLVSLFVARQNSEGKERGGGAKED